MRIRDGVQTCALPISGPHFSCNTKGSPAPAGGPFRFRGSQTFHPQTHHMPPTKKPHRIAPAGLIFVRPSGWRGLFSLAAFRALFDLHPVGGEVLALHLAERVGADRGFGALRRFGRMRSEERRGGKECVRTGSTGWEGYS